MTNPNAPLPESAADMEKTPYLVYLAIPVEGYDPVDAAARWLNEVVLQGLTSMDLMAMDLEDQSLWVVHPDETYDEYTDPVVEDIDMANEDAVYAAVAERLARDGINLDEIVARGIVDVELPDFTPPEEGKKKGKKKKGAPVTGPCVRCKEENVLNEDGLCPECVVDLEGASA